MRNPERDSGSPKSKARLSLSDRGFRSFAGAPSDDDEAVLAAESLESKGEGRSGLVVPIAGRVKGRVKLYMLRSTS